MEDRKAYMIILQEIEKMVLENKLSAGDKLPSERELADKLSAGRSSVREALRVLEVLDLIETRKGEGTYLKEAGSHRLAELLASFFLKDEKAKQDLSETREMIEKEAVRLACGRITNDQLTLLKNSIEKGKEKANKGEIPHEEDFQFHKLLINSAHNKLILNIWMATAAYSKPILRASLSREGRVSVALKEHQEIYEAIVRRDEKTASSALVAHLQNSIF